MKIMGLDLSLLATGVCIISGDTGSTPRVDTVLLKKEKTSSIVGSINRLVSIAGDISKIIKDESPDMIVIEAAAKNQVWQAAAIGELHGVVKTQILIGHGMVPRVEQATRMRKAVVGHISQKREKYLDKEGKQKQRTNYGTVSGKNGKPKRATVKDLIEIRLKEQGMRFPSQDEMDAYVAAKFGWDLMIDTGKAI